MDQFAASHIAITNLLTNAVELHNAAAGKIDALSLAKSKGETIPTLAEVGIDLDNLSKTYEEIRELAIISGYLAGHDFFTLMNDFKVTRPTLIKVLKKHSIEIRK